MVRIIRILRSMLPAYLTRDIRSGKVMEQQNAPRCSGVGRVDREKRGSNSPAAGTTHFLALVLGGGGGGKVYSPSTWSWEPSALPVLL